MLNSVPVLFDLFVAALVSPTIERRRGRLAAVIVAVGLGSAAYYALAVLMKGVLLSL